MFVLRYDLQRCIGQRRKQAIANSRTVATGDQRRAKRRKRRRLRRRQLKRARPASKNEHLRPQTSRG